MRRPGDRSTARAKIGYQRSRYFTGKSSRLWRYTWVPAWLRIEEGGCHSLQNCGPGSGRIHAVSNLAGINWSDYGELQRICNRRREHVRQFSHCAHRISRVYGPSLSNGRKLRLGLLPWREKRVTTLLLASAQNQNVFAQIRSSDFLLVL